MINIRNIISRIFQNNKTFGDSAFYNINKVGLKNIAGNQINPATEDTIVLINSVLDAIYARQADGNAKNKIIDSAGTVQDWTMPEGQAASANSMPMVLSTEQEAMLAYLSDLPSIDGNTAATNDTLGTFDLSDAPTVNEKLESLRNRIGEVQASPTANTALDRLKTIANNQLPDGHAVQNKYVLPLATNVSSTLTLTSASTAYQITEPTSDFLVTYCNNSDTDMYYGFATLTTGGILLPKNGGTVALVCAANSSPFFYCASAGKVLNYTTTLI